MEIAVFFIAQWYLSLFAQTVFLHRHSAHGMFSMSRSWERIFFVFTFVVQGSSFLNPRAYAVMHRMHHAYSDTEKDPHSPSFFKDVVHLMLETKRIYMGLLKGTIKPEERFTGKYPVWERFEKFADMWVPRAVWLLLCGACYYVFATSWWVYLLLPVQALMGPIHGAIVNWCGHKYGYTNFDNRDHSRNTVNVDIFLMGELLQNNHHKYPNRPNFAVKWFEWDPTATLLVFMDWIGVIGLKRHKATTSP